MFHSCYSLQIEFNLNTYNNTLDLLNAINFRYDGGTTNTAEAIRLAYQTMFTPENGDRPNAVNILIIITDGKSDNRDDTLQTALQVQNLHSVIL